VSFTIERWSEKLKDSLRAWDVDPMGKLDSLGAKSLYFAAAASALAPAAALASNDPATLSALSSLGAGVGANLIANVIQNWKDEKSAAEGIALFGSRGVAAKPMGESKTAQAAGRRL
jgi:hypothetical protein